MNVKLKHLLIGAGILWLPLIARADLLSTVLYQGCVNQCESGFQFHDSTSTSLPITVTGPGGYASASSNYGVLKAGVRSAFVGDFTGFEVDTSGTAYASSTDFVRVLGRNGAGNGRLLLRLSGSFSTQGGFDHYAHSSASAAISISGHGAEGAFIGGVLNRETIAVLFPYYYGEPLSLSMSLSTNAAMGGIVDFGHTATLAFELPEGAYLLADSGASYPLNQVPVPAVYGLLLAGFAAIAAARRHRRTSRCLATQLD